MEDCECSVIASATAQVSDGVAVSYDGASLSIGGCSSLPASQSPADLRASGTSRQGPGEGDADCGSSSVHQLLELELLKRSQPTTVDPL